MFNAVFWPTTVSMCVEMLRALQGILQCEKNMKAHHLRNPEAFLQTSNPLPEELGGSRTSSLNLGNGLLCSIDNRSSTIEPLSHRLVKEAILTAPGCAHMQICPECK